MKLKTNSQNLRQILLTLLLVGAASIGSLNAAPMAADDDGEVLYDGQYSRPTIFPDFTQPTQWPTTMSYFVNVKMDEVDIVMSKFEVAVYDQNGTLRHCGRSITSQHDICTLTIPGEYGDSFTFKVIYGDFDNPTIVDAAETVNFKSNQIMGGISKPFYLTIPKDETVIPTAIEAVSRDGASAPAYTLSGVLAGSANGRGIIIKNGKKVFEK